MQSEARLAIIYIQNDGESENKRIIPRWAPTLWAKIGSI